jgi:hypothetical protein
MALVRILLIALALAGLSWFQFLNSASAREVGRDLADLADSRPVQSVLFVGNSRMYSHEMPPLVREIADSAGAPVRYRIRMWALPGQTFPGHHADPNVQALLTKKWDRVIFQGESGAHHTDESRRDFTDYGTQLISKAKAAGSPASLIVGWTYGPAFYEEHWPGGRAWHHRAIQDDYRVLARRTDAGLIDAGGAWRRMEAKAPDFSLAPDGNHPSVHGAYLTALMVYAHLTEGDVSKVTWAPEGVTPEQGAQLRALANEFLASGG